MASSITDKFVKCSFGRVAEWWVSNVVRKSCRLGYFRVKATQVVYLLRLIFPACVFCYPSGNLSDLHGMRKTVMECEALMGTDDLRYTQEPPEGIAIQHSITVTSPARASVVRRSTVVPSVLAHSRVPATRRELLGELGDEAWPQGDCVLGEHLVEATLQRRKVGIGSLASLSKPSPVAILIILDCVADGIIDVSRPFFSHGNLCLIVRFPATRVVRSRCAELYP